MLTYCKSLCGSAYGTEGKLFCMAGDSVSSSPQPETNFLKDKGDLGYIIFPALPVLTLTNILVASRTKCLQHG